MNDETMVYVCTSASHIDPAFVTLSARDAAAWLEENAYSGEVHAWSGGEYRASYVASTIHIPWAYGGSDDDENLVASCMICNVIAGSRVFDSFDDKRQYILANIDSWYDRRARRLRKLLSVCPDCQEIFIPNIDGATVVLCSVCFERDENGENGAIHPELAS